MKKGLLFVMLFLVVGCSSIREPEASETVNDEIVVLAEDLTIPWTINKEGDTFYVSERGGAIVKINSNSEEMERQKVIVSKEIAHIGEGGLLGFLLDPHFEQNQEAFMYYTYESGQEIWNRIVKVRLDNGEWNEITSLLEDIPGSNFHNGGRLAIGPDDKLYATTGDAGNSDLSQNINSLAGKILRMNLDGSIPADNPFQHSYVFTYGHRNPQGLAWDSNGNMYSTEHGQSAHDEINKIEAGKNYGWPIIQGDEEESNMEVPLFHTGNETWAPSGITIFGDHLFIATLRGEKLIDFHLRNQSYDVIYEDGGRLRDVWTDGEYLYTITNNKDGRGTPRENDDKLIRINRVD